MEELVPRTEDISHAILTPRQLLRARVHVGDVNVTPGDCLNPVAFGYFPMLDAKVQIVQGALAIRVKLTHEPVAVAVHLDDERPVTVVELCLEPRLSLYVVALRDRARGIGELRALVLPGWDALHRQLNVGEDGRLAPGV